MTTMKRMTQRICVSYALSQFLDALYFAYTFSPHIFFKVVLVVKFNKLNSLDSYPNYFMLYLKQQKHLILSIAVIRILVVCCLIPGNLYYEFKKTFEISGNQYKCKEYHFLLVLFWITKVFVFRVSVTCLWDYFIK